MTRACIFCGATDLTLEDVWPRWLNRVLPSDGSSLVAVRHATSREGETTGNAWVAGEKFNTTARVVCAGCNNGWMSRLESRTIPILTPLILGKPTDVPPADQIVVATWTVKTAMVFEYANPGRHRIFTAEARRFLMEQDRPPMDARVRIATMAGKSLLECRRWNASKEDDDNRMGVSVGLRIGHVALNVLYADGAMNEIPGFERLETRTDRYVPLYPPSLRTEHLPTLTALEGDDDFDAYVREPFVDMNEKDHLAVVRAEKNLRAAITDAASRFGEQ